MYVCVSVGTSEVWAFYCVANLGIELCRMVMNVLEGVFACFYAGLRLGVAVQFSHNHFCIVLGLAKFGFSLGLFVSAMNIFFE